MADSFLSIVKLTKRYGDRTVLDGISCDIAKGEVVGLLGPNGAGKSTTMNIVAGFLKPTAGDVLLEGRSVLDGPQEWRSSLGVVLDDLALFEYLTVAEHLALVGQLYGLSRAETAKRADELVDFFSLTEATDTIAREASHGTRKKLALALSLMHGPRVLLLDESLNGIDAVTARDFKVLLRKMSQKGTTVLITSHMLDATQQMIDRCVMLNHGRIVLDSSLQEIAGLEETYVKVICGPERRDPELSWV